MQITPTEFLSHLKRLAPSLPQTASFMSKVQDLGLSSLEFLLLVSELESGLALRVDVEALLDRGDELTLSDLFGALRPT